MGVVPQDVREEVDEHIFANRKLKAIMALKRTGLCLSGSVGVLGDRYRALKQLYPERFPETDEEYWRGFYS
ncbi:MAG: hypothetical protein AAF645_02385 [Myxococcota bacterium]